MVEWTAIVLPALVATGLVFVASSVVHMVLQLHNPDYRKLANEDAVRDAINAGSPVPAQYIVPHCTDPKEGATPEMVKKFTEGPVAVVWLKEPGQMKIGPFLLKWILYSLAVSLVAGYLARETVEAGAPYLKVFQVTGTAAWLAYAWGGPIDSIWKGKPWAITVRGFVDGLVYALLTAGAFAAMWPE